MKHEKSKNDAMRHELDHIDAKILNLLRENARMPLKEIAEHVFLSSPAVSARIERLEKDGIIAGYHAGEGRLHYRISGQIKSGAFGISDQSVHQPRG